MRKQKLRKMILFLLTAVMVCSLFVAPVWAEDAENAEMVSDETDQELSALYDDPGFDDPNLLMGAFGDCPNLETVDISENCKLKEFPMYCFGRDFKLKAITIPKACQTIRGFAFVRCTSLNTITFSKDAQLEVIYAGNFDYRDSGASLKNVNLFPNSIKEVYGSCNGYMRDKIDPVNSNLAIVQNSFGGYGNKSSFTLPANLRIIRGDCFEDNNLTDIYVPDTLQEVGDDYGHSFDGLNSKPLLHVVKSSAGYEYAKTSCYAGSSYSSEWAVPYTTGLMEDCEVIVPDAAYTGKAVKPAVTVNFLMFYHGWGRDDDPDYPAFTNRLKLTEGKDYTVQYKNNVEQGQATVIVTGIGEYSGTQTGHFWIKKNVTNVPVTGVSLNTHKKTIYVGDSFTLAASVLPADATNRQVNWSGGGAASVSNGVVTGVLEGTSVITVTTVDGGYTDTCTVTVEKKPAAHTHSLVDHAAVPVTCTTDGNIVYLQCKGCNKYFSTSYQELTWDEIVIKATGHKLTQHARQEATCTQDGCKRYWSCDNCGLCFSDAEGKTKVDLTTLVLPKTGHSWDNGSVTTKPTCTEDGVRTYTCANCGKTKTEAISATGHKWDDGKVTTKPTCSKAGVKTYTCQTCSKTKTETIAATGNHVYDEGKVTTAPTCTKAGVKTYTCKTCEKTKTETIPVTDHTCKLVTTKAKLLKDGSIVSKCSICGYIESTKVISHPASYMISPSSYTYSGSAKKPAVTVKDAKGNTIAKSNYSLSYTDNVNPGTATLTVKFKGNYTGSKQLHFIINPKGTSISSVTAATKGFTVKWKKQATQTTGYEIQYSTSKNFTSGTKSVIVGKTKTSKKITGLKANKTYYVRIRTYKTAGGKKYYSAWSSKKTITTKK